MSQHWNPPVYGSTTVPLPEAESVTASLVRKLAQQLADLEAALEQERKDRAAEDTRLWRHIDIVEVRVTER